MRDLKLALVIQALVKGAKDVTGLTGSVRDLGAEATKKVPDPTEPLREGAKATKLSIQDLTQALAGLVTVGAITQFARSAIQEFSKAESAFRGLEAVANASGAGIGNALREAERLAADGLISVADASKSLQNLLSRGYNLDQAVATIERLKDAAAFNRQASLSMAEAVVSATEGLKNENSILVDNAGVTKNVAKMWEEYARQRGLATTELTQAQKIEAEYLGILQETTAQVGNAQKALEGFQGQQAQAEQASVKFKQALGEGLAPAMAGLYQAGTAVIEGFFKPLLFLAQAAGVRVAQVGLAFGAIWDAIVSRDFSGLRERVRQQGELAEREIEAIASRLSGGRLRISESLTGGADPEKLKATEERLKGAGTAGAKAAEEQAKSIRKSIDESIKDYQRLAAEIGRALEAAGKQAADYRAQAAKLRAEASAGPRDESVEGQAFAMLDLLAAEEKLLRLRSQPGGLEAAREQSELVQRLAGQLSDQARAQEAVKNAKLAEAAAFEQAAREQETRQAGLIEQQRQAEQVVKDLQAALESIGRGTAIRIESDQAKAALEAITAQLDGLKDKTITVKVVRLDEKTGQPMDNLALPARALGGPIFGPGGPTDDRILARLSNNEHVLTAAEVEAAGGHAAIYRLRALLRAGRLPGFAAGGAVLSATSRLAGASLPGALAPAFPDLGRIELGLAGGDYPLYATPDVAEGLADALRAAAMKRGAR